MMIDAHTHHKVQGLVTRCSTGAAIHVRCQMYEQARYLGGTAARARRPWLRHIRRRRGRLRALVRAWRSSISSRVGAQLRRSRDLGEQRLRVLAQAKVGDSLSMRRRGALLCCAVVTCSPLALKVAEDACKGAATRRRCAMGICSACGQLNKSLVDTDLC